MDRPAYEEVFYAGVDNSDPEDAFRSAAFKARLGAGNNPVGIGAKRGWLAVTDQTLTPGDAVDVIEGMIAANDARIAEAWQPAVAVRIAGPDEDGTWRDGWLFAGIAPAWEPAPAWE